MKFQFLAGLAALSLLIACGSSNPLDGSDKIPQPPPPPAVPEPEVMEEMVFYTLPGTINDVLQRTAFDPEAEVRTPAPEPDFNGFLASLVHDGRLHRTITVLSRESDRGTVMALVAADGDRFHRDGTGENYVMRLGPLDMPTSGAAIYNGAYVGLLPIGPLHEDDEIPEEIWTSGNDHITGEILLEAKFLGQTVEGVIYDRRLVGEDDDIVLESVVLKYTGINPDGSFLGDVEFEHAPSTKIGNYGGAFGGAEASDVAGIVQINPVRDNTSVWEYGAFVLGKCGLAGEGALCAQN